jgi:hypothetical protein
MRDIEGIKRLRIHLSDLGQSLVIDVIVEIVMTSCLTRHKLEASEERFGLYVLCVGVCDRRTGNILHSDENPAKI